jgi:hypothetical protein
MTGDDAPTSADVSDGAPESLGDHQSFDTSVAHVARVYDYWLGGCSL